MAKLTQFNHPRSAVIAADGGRVVGKKEKPEKVPVIVFQPAYDGGVCHLDKNDWPFPVIFDVSGMEPIQKMPIVRDHDQKQKVGQTFRVDYLPNRIDARGKMIHLGIDDSADKVLALWQRGAKLEASIHTDVIPPEDVDLIPDGETIAVNGQEFTGPAEVVRRTRLREISIVTVGANAGTAVDIQAAMAQTQQEEKTMSKNKGTLWTTMMKKLGWDGLSKTQVLARVALAADEAPDKPAEAEDETDKTAEAEESQDKEAEAEEDAGFEEWLIGHGFDRASLTEETLAALHAMFSSAASEDDSEKPASCEDTTEKQAAAGDETEPKSDASASAPVGSGYRRKSARTRAGSASLSIPKSTFSGPGPSGGPHPARVSEAALLIGCGMRAEKIDRHALGNNGFTETELNEAMSGDYQRETPMTTLFRAAMCSGTNYKDTVHVAQAMNYAKFQAQAMNLRPGEYVNRRSAQAAGNLANVDVPTIFANVMYKSLLVGFQDVPDPTDGLSKVVKAADFRTQYFWTLQSNGEFKDVMENGELNVLKLSDTPYTNAATLKGAECRYSYAMLVNDDQNALSDIPNHMGRRFKIQKQSHWWKTLCDHLADVTHVTSNPTLGVAGLDTAFGQMAAVRDNNSEPMVVNPKFVVVPTALGGTVRQIHTALDVVAAGGTALSIIPNANVYNQAFDPIVSPFVGLGSKNATAWGNSSWMLLADPADLPAMIMSYLGGNNAPTMETKQGDFAVEGVRIGTWWGFGASFADAKAALFSNGSAS